MKSNYKRIGEHIRLVDERNKGLQVKQLLGLSISKQFIPSVANIIGTDMENYKIIRKNQFACSTMQVRRDKKMPVALLKDLDEAIISQAYPIFEVKDPKELLPEYLMMWFTRSEFDREACFHAVGGVRGSLEWEDFENMQLPIPHPDKQREIVKEYNVIQNRIDLNQQLIQKLEETAQAIYKQWFVEFEFPDENGKPYKSNGGEMVWNEELQKEIPLGWICSKIGDVAQVVDCLHSKKPNQILKDTGGILLQIENIADLGLLNMSRKYFISKNDYKLWTSRIELSEGDCILTNVGVDAIAQIPKGFNAALGRNMTGVRCKKDFEYPSFLITTLLSNSMKIEIENKKDTGTIMQALNVSSIPHLRFVKGVSIVLMKFENLAKSIRLEMELLYRQNQKLTELKELLLSKLATVE
jgi:type I restriction enzyme S subunit